MSKEALQADNNRFIENVKYYIDRYGIENVYNSNQSGFQLELHAGRILAKKSVKKVECSTINICDYAQLYNTTVISADGRLLSPLLIVLKEPSGTLGPRVQETMFTANNIFIMSKSINI